MVFAQSRPRGEIQIAPSELDGGKLAAAANAHAIALYNEFGCLVLHDVFSREYIAELNAAFIARYATEGPTALEESSLKVGDKRMMVSIEVSPPFNRPVLYANPILLPLFAELMEGDCVINGFGGVVAFPGAKGQPPHRDHPFLFGGEEGNAGEWKLGGSVPPYAITMVVPLVDLTLSVGPTTLWEESHRTGCSVGRVLTTHRASLPLVPSGDVYLMDYRLVHGGMPNLSKTPRAIMYVIYSRRWFRDTVNYSKQEPIIISKAEYEQLPKEHKPLFSLARPY